MTPHLPFLGWGSIRSAPQLGKALLSRSPALEHNKHCSRLSSIHYFLELPPMPSTKLLRKTLKFQGPKISPQGGHTQPTSASIKPAGRDHMENLNASTETTPRAAHPHPSTIKVPSTRDRARSVCNRQALLHKHHLN